MMPLFIAPELKNGIANGAIIPPVPHQCHALASWPRTQAGILFQGARRLAERKSRSTANRSGPSGKDGQEVTGKQNNPVVDQYGVLPHIKSRIKQIYGTQRIFAAALGCSTSHLSDAMNGRCGYPKGFWEGLKIRRKTYFELEPVE